MVLVVSSMEYKPARLKMALEYLKKVANYEKTAFGVEFEILRRLTGAPGQAGRLVVTARFDSVAAWDEHQQKESADSKWQALVDEGFGSEDSIFIHNTFSRNFLAVQ